MKPVVWLKPLPAPQVLVVYGGGSVVRSGLLASVRKSLEAAGMTVIEKGGVHPNPRLCFVRETVDWMRDQAWVLSSPWAAAP